MMERSLSNENYSQKNMINLSQLHPSVHSNHKSYHSVPQISESEKEANGNQVPSLTSCSKSNTNSSATSRENNLALILGEGNVDNEDGKIVSWRETEDTLQSQRSLEAINRHQAHNLALPEFESPRKRSVDFLLDIPKVLHDVTHVTQKSNWDCGISCVAMCLSDTQRKHFFSNLDYFCNNKVDGFGNSTWTIDLCYILAHYGIEHEMFTISMGVNPDLRKENFYRSIIDLDTQRVMERFRNRASHGIRVYKQSVSIEDIFCYLAGTGPLIVLVNANLLHCQSCSWKIVQVCRSWCCQQYQGHYIVVIGYNVERKIIYCRNPGLSERICQIKVSDFEDARMSFGTDEDTIVVELNSPSEVK